MPLEVELKLFEEKREEWLAHHEGKFALISEQQVAGFYDSAESAYEEGVLRWGTVPFLIKQISRSDPIEHIPALVHGLINAGT